MGTASGFKEGQYLQVALPHPCLGQAKSKRNNDIQFWLSLTQIRYRDQTLKQWSFPMLARPCYFSSEPFKLEELRQSLFDSSIALKYRMNLFSLLVNIFSVSLMIYVCSRQQNLPRQHQRQPEQQAQNRISFANGINNSGRCKWYRKSTSTNNCGAWLRGIYCVRNFAHPSMWQEWQLS